MTRARAPAPETLGDEDDLAEQVARDHGAEAVAGVLQRQHPVDDRPDAGLLAEPGQPAQLVPGAHGGPDHRQLGRLARFCEQADVRPVIDRVLPLASARDGFAAMITGDLFGKIVFVP